MTEQAIWITVEEPVTQDEMENIRRVLRDTDLSDRYELILTSDRIDTLDMDDLRELISND